MTIQRKVTETARKRYNRIAPTYDLMQWFGERRFSKWRKILWGKVDGRNVLEIGVGTGNNMPYYPAGAEITAVDFSEKMLARARVRARKLGTKVRLMQMDAQKLEFPGDTFDTVVATFVFCSVPDPVLGLKEIYRVLKPGGKVLLLEHVLAANRVLALLMNLVNPVVVRVMGANINRRSIENVALAGLKVEHVMDLSGEIFKLIEGVKE